MPHLSSPRRRGSSGDNIFLCDPGSEAGMTIIDYEKNILIISVVLLLASNAHAREYYVKDVIDGDTIVLKSGEHVRYIGIDTPEVRTRKNEEWVYDPEAYAEKAKEFNKKSVSNKIVKIEFDFDKEDKYKRILAYVYDDKGEMVNLKLIEEGLASMYTFYPNTKYFDVFFQAQKEAIRDEKGIWSNVENISPNVAQNYVGKICKVKGVVSSVKVFPRITFINFDGVGKNGFKIVVFNENKRMIEKNGMKFESLIGKDFVIIGKIINKGGPQVILDNFSQIFSKSI